MPVYEYTCNECGHKSEKLRKMEHRDEPLQCGECGGESVRVISKPSDPHFSGSGWTPKFHR